jgi:CDP-paratose synthetase
MNIIIAGATGFLGSYLTKSFIDQGHKVIALIKKDSNKYRLNDYLDQCIFYSNPEDDFDYIFEENNIDIVINTVVNYGRKSKELNPILRSNLTFGLSLLESSIKYKVKAYINSDTMLDREIDAYSLSKAQFLDWMKFLPTLSTKTINIKIEHIYGTLDDDNKFIYWFIRQLQQNVEFIDLTTGIQKRDFVYIDDVVSAYNVITKNIESFADYEEFEIGSDNPMPVREIVNKIYTKVLNHKKIITKLNFGAVKYRNNEKMELNLDTSRIKALGWSANVDLDDGIDKIIDEIFNKIKHDK